MNEKFNDIATLESKLGVTSWTELTQDQIFELLKLAGEEKLISSVLSKVVELAPNLRDLTVNCLDSVRESAAAMRERQQQSLEIIGKAIDAFDRHISTLLSCWTTTNDPDRIARLVENLSKRMVELIHVVERVSADNNKNWRETIRWIAKWGFGLIAVGGSVAAVARRR